MAKHGQQIDTSRSRGRTVAEMWVYHFELNERLFRSGAAVMEDEDITAAMVLVFPDRITSTIFREVNRVRNRYNRGELPPQKGVVPEQQSWRMRNINGRALRCNPRGYPFPEVWQDPKLSEPPRYREFDPKNRKSNEAGQ